jgi:hypothetical protein
VENFFCRPFSFACRVGLVVVGSVCWTTSSYWVDPTTNSRVLVGKADPNPSQESASFFKQFRYSLCHSVLLLQVTVTCEFDVSYFPYDTQTCSLDLSSWMYTAEEIDLYPFDPVDMTQYNENDGNYFSVSWLDEKGYCDKNRTLQEKSSESFVNKEIWYCFIIFIDTRSYWRRSVIVIPVTLVWGQLNAGDRREGVAGVQYFVSRFGREIQKLEKKFGLRPNDKGGPLPRLRLSNE